MDLFLHYLSMPYLIQGIVFTLAATGIGLAGGMVAVSYTHLTLPTNREV